MLVGGKALSELGEKMQKEVIEQMSLLARLCLGRNYKSMKHVAAIFEESALLGSLGSEELSRDLRSALLELATMVYLDCAPRLKQIGDQLTFIEGQARWSQGAQDSSEIVTRLRAIIPAFFNQQVENDLLTLSFVKAIKLML